MRVRRWRACVKGLRQGVRIHGAGDLREAGAEVLKAGRLFGGCRERLDHRLHGRFPAVDGDGDGAVDRVAFGARPCRGGARPGPACPGVPVACPVRQARHVLAVLRLGEARPHALSGVDVGGQSISVGFEDLTGGGDQDYEDVVFRVEVVDDFMFV